MKSNKVSTKIRILYGIGAAANAIRTILFGLFSLFFYTSLMGLPGTLVGIGAAISLLWDALIDPYIGTISDNSRGRLGKRHGLMLLGSATMGLAFWAFFSPPQGLPTWALFLWALVSGILVRTATSLFVVPYYAFGADLTDDYHERTTIVAIRSAFALLSTLVTVVLSFAFFLPSDLQLDPNLTIEGYRSMGMFAGLLMTATGLITTWGTLSQRQYAVSEATILSFSVGIRRLIGDLLNALKIHSFRVLFISYSLFFLGVVINATLGIHFVNYYAGIRAGNSLALYQLSFYIGAIFGIFFWVHYAKNVEKKLLYFAGITATSLTMTGAFFMFGEGNLFGTGNLYPLLIGHGVSGFFGSVLWIIPASMLADVVDEDEFQTGRRQEGTLFGLFSFGEQIAAGGAIVIGGILLDSFVGLQPGEMEQSPVTIERIGILYGLVPAIVLVLSAAVILRYHITEEQLNAYQDKLRRH